MVAPQTTTLDQFERLHARAGEVDLASFLRSNPALDDDTLAEIIELDARLRLDSGKHVDLNRYLATIPGIRNRLLPLDAAVDMALRALSGGSTPSPQAIQTLESRYPDLTEIIREAAQLADAICSTAAFGAQASPRPPRNLPCDLGPHMADARARYQLTRALGSGSQGQVFLAEDRLLSEGDLPAMVAIKILACDANVVDQRARMLEEATKARRINHPNVVRVLDRGMSTDGEDYIVYEYVIGGDLGTYLERSGLPLNPRDAATMVSQVARGLQAAHSAGLVHCDLKPSNIMLDGATCKVADFGTAIRLGAGIDLTGDPKYRTVLGNLAFISPEQFRFLEAGATIPSDVYALGGILYYLVTGELPNGGTIEEIALRHDPESTGMPPSLRQRCPKADRDLDAICSRAMSKDPARRHQSAGEFADDLDHWLGHRPISWSSPSLTHRSMLLFRRNPRAATLVVSLVLVAVAAAFVGAGQLRNAQRERLTRVIQETQQEMLKTQQVQELNGAIIALTAMRAVGSNGPALSSIILTDSLVSQWAFGPSFFATINAMPEAWAERIQLARSHLDSDPKSPPSMETLLWESSLGFWLLSSCKPDEALPVIQHNRCWLEPPLRVHESG